MTVIILGMSAGYECHGAALKKLERRAGGKGAIQCGKQMSLLCRQVRQHRDGSPGPIRDIESLCLYTIGQYNIAKFTYFVAGFALQGILPIFYLSFTAH